MEQLEKMYDYTCEQYNEDLNKIEKYIKDNYKKVHLFAPAYGGLPMGVALKNRLNCKMSIVKMSHYDGEDKVARFLHLAEVHTDDTLIILDDLWDTGKTIKETETLLNYTFKKHSVSVITLIGRKEDTQRNHWYTREHPGQWIKFTPWE